MSNDAGSREGPKLNESQPIQKEKYTRDGEMEGEEEGEEGVTPGCLLDGTGQIVISLTEIGKTWNEAWFEFSLGHVEFGVPMRQLSGDVRWTVGYERLDFRREVWGEMLNCKP